MCFVLFWIVKVQSECECSPLPSKWMTRPIILHCTGHPPPSGLCLYQESPSLHHIHPPAETGWGGPTDHLFALLCAYMANNMLGKSTQINLNETSVCVLLRWYCSLVSISGFLMDKYTCHLMDKIFLLKYIFLIDWTISY